METQTKRLISEPQIIYQVEHEDVSPQTMLSLTKKGFDSSIIRNTVKEKLTNQWIAIFYSEIFPQDISVYDMAIKCPFSEKDHLEPEQLRENLPSIIHEFESVKLKAKQFTQDYLAQNPEYKYYRITLNQTWNTK